MAVCRINPWLSEVPSLPAEEFRGLGVRVWILPRLRCAPAHVAAAAPLGSPVEASHGSELSGSPPHKEGEMCFWKQRSLLISCCSSWHPFAGQLDLALHLAPASVPGLGARPHFFSACLLVSALLLLLFSSFHLCQ